jgi:NADPH2:quinone reductase
MTKAIRIHETGGPEVMRWEDIDLGAPGLGQVLVRHTAIGLNYIDTYHRSGLYPLPLPSGLGLEAAGVVEAVSDDVTEFKTGDRIAYGTGPMGAYAEAALVPASNLVPIPNGISDEIAAAALLKGMTAQFLLRQTYPVAAGETILVHAAAGGVGLILVQWAKHLGARVIGTAGSEEKAQLARDHGCDEIILYRETDVAARLRELTSGEGVSVVYDGVGKDTWAASLGSLRPRGMMVSYGNASGAVEPFAPIDLAAHGSLYVTRPTLFHYTATPDALRSTAREAFFVILNGNVKIRIDQTFSLSDAAKAHSALESRATTGATLLLP